MTGDDASAGGAAATLLAPLLPPGTATAEAFDDPPGVALFPEEEARLARAVDKRRREFGTVRACARRALGTLGVPPVPILPGDKGAPRWPPGIIGSMTHTDGYRGAAVARAGDLAGLGIDAEPHAPLPGGVLRLVTRPPEAAQLRDLAARRPEVAWDRLLFCAKEAVYKAWFPLTGRWLGFEDAEVDLAGEEGAFVARLLVPGPRLGGRELTAFTGRWRVAAGLALAAVSVPHPGAPARP